MTIHEPTQRLEVDQPVLALASRAATDASAVGAKAAHLAVANQARLPVLEGFVVPVAAVHSVLHDAGRIDVEHLHPAWSRLSDGGRLPVVVRSSSPHEDTASSSMAGVFESVVDVRGWNAFGEALRTVIQSAGGGDMAILVQRHLEPQLSGVLFGVDPVGGRRDHRVVVAVRGGPWRLVQGEVEGRRTVVTASGRAVRADGDEDPRLDLRQRRHLIRLEARAAGLFGGPQDIEWAIDEHGAVVLLQSRPVTATTGPVSGPLLGPGPVAETFPAPLSRLEQDLWLPPLRLAMETTLALLGAASRRRIDRSPVLVAVGGRVAADLELLGEVPGRRRLWAMLDPRPSLRRLGVAWQVGRLRAALPALAADLVAQTDLDLGSLPNLSSLGDDQLLALVHNARRYLVALHGHEMLAGALVDDEGSTAAGAALAAIAEGQAAGWSDEDVVARSPVVLAIVAPSVIGTTSLPRVEATDAVVALGDLTVRETLRLRARWTQELTARTSREIGRRLTERGTIGRIDDVARVGLDDLGAALRGELVMLDTAVTDPVAAPLPAAFRLTDDGAVVASMPSEHADGRGAGGGRGEGVVVHTAPGPGDVLVVPTLDPSLAPLLPRLAGLVSETGSPLSHLAILAREHRVPVVVGYTEARARLRPGTWVVVDGTSGSVEALDTPPRQEVAS